jgi:hypothetical protein
MFKIFIVRLRAFVSISILKQMVYIKKNHMKLILWEYRQATFS